MWPNTIVMASPINEGGGEVRKRFFPNPSGKQTTAVLYCCPDCQVWWGSSEHQTLQDNQVFRLAEPASDMFKWEDYRGWRSGDPHTCPECGQHIEKPSYTLHS
ncbi:MAG: hypothetical protein H6654_01560 [Ardenticatenaceae bacterium]|nr:hypothetical protein [Anaerolineales bacterium]MCB8940871.1 hypothetical protein [Ardenticatenaceae bacterium]MCB8972210.1 hypothetical protein [Ardenticatenaceae bacterium]